MEAMTLKTVAAFLNSYDGGTLLISVTDSGEATGLATDFASLRKGGKGDADVFPLHLNQLMTASLGAASVTNVYTEIVEWAGQSVCRVLVKPSGFPVNATVKLPNKSGQYETKTVMYVRLNIATHKFKGDDDEKQKFTT
jgi:hypothetical protein